MKIEIRFSRAELEEILARHLADMGNVDVPSAKYTTLEINDCLDEVVLSWEIHTKETRP